MKKILTLFMCLSLVGLYSCSSDDDNDNSNKQILQILTREQSQSGVYPYNGAYVYLFMDIDNRNNEYSFIKGGTLKKGDQAITYTKIAITKDGKANIEYNFGNRPFTVIVARGVEMASYKTFYYEKFDNNTPIDILYKDGEM